MMARPTYLTPHTAKCSSESADGTDLPEAGAPEIEVTPAIIEAGVSALCEIEPLFYTDAEIVKRIFGAMVSPLGVRVLNGGLSGDPV
jgi:hypothetical protein